MPNIKTFYKSKNGDTNISTNFKIREFACKDGTDKILIDTEMIPVLQKIRDLLGTTIINSAYRTESYNRRVDGAKNSFHLYGRAFDINAGQNNLNNLCKIANTLGVKGIILYNTFVHIDSRAVRYHFNNVTKKNVAFGYYDIPFISIIKNGSKGTDAGIIQFKLNRLGYNCGVVDSFVGHKTIKAIKQFQQNNNLDVDGIVGPKTWSKLFG